MACSCKNKTKQPKRINPPIQQAISPPQSPPNNINPLSFASVQLPPPSKSDPDRRRIQKLRQDAINRSLGKNL